VKEKDGAGSPGTPPASATMRSLRDVLPPSDPAYPILADILRLVPVSRWSFGRITTKGELVLLCCSQGNGEELRRLAAEFKSQRASSHVGPMIAATATSMEEFDAGMTLVFADARASFGILMLLRKAALGAFTSSEISTMTFALEALSERLSVKGVQQHSQADAGSDRDAGAGEYPALEEAFYILNEDLQIVSAWSAQEQRPLDVSGDRTKIAERLPAGLEETVRELTVDWVTTSPKKTRTARGASFLVVRTQPMAGPDGLFIGVRIARFRSPNSLIEPTSRFNISAREVQVLALLLDGSTLNEIASALHIATSTVQDHINSLLHKTESRNRSELLARVLGWQSRPKGHSA
jgi:DNA-binding CsgD family transcriptional regulator